MSKPGPQSGILNRPTEHLLVAALTFAGPREQVTCREIVEELRAIVHAELTSDLEEIDASADGSQVARETGELGFKDRWDRQHLTITVGFSAAGYDALGLPAGHADRPADLIAAPWAQFGDPVPPAGDGDIVVHVNSDNLYVTEHVLRRIEHTLTGRLEVSWAQWGAQRYGSRAGRIAASEARARACQVLCVRA